MEEAMEFGKRLKELRTKTGMTLRELAEKVDVDFTYLSKIENGVLPPPSEKVIRHLTEVLNADKDELITLAGKIPSDIVEILKNKEALQLLRSDQTRKKVKAAGKKGESFNMLKYIKSMSRVAIPLLLVVAVATSLWYVSPTQALEIDITLPASGTVGSTHTFTVTVTIQDPDLVPIQTVNATIYNEANPSTYKATLANLPKETTSRQSHTISEGSSSGSAEVASTTGAGWTYTTGDGYAAWKGGGYSFGSPTSGYAYAYSGQTDITYTIYWTSPSSWPAGDYKMKIDLTAQDATLTKIFTETSSSSFALTTADNGGVAAAPGAPPPVVTPEELAEMTDEAAAEALEGLTPGAAADILEEVATDKAADIIEEIATDVAADIIEEVATDVAADIIEEVATDVAADIIEEVATDKAADIIEEVATDKAAGVIEEVVTEKAAEILEEVSAVKAAAIMDELTADKLNETIPKMSEDALTERLPDMSIETLESIDLQVLFASLPSAPTEQLASEDPPQPPKDLDEPIVLSTTPLGVKYLQVRTSAGDWVTIVGTPMPVDKLLIKTKAALENIETTLEVLDRRPEEVLKDLPADQVVLSYLSITIENASPEDIEVGHMTFMVEKDWLEQNSIHKWSVTLNRYDSELYKWIALPTKRVAEDDTYVYYTASITRFSIFAITGSQDIAPVTVEVSNLVVNPASIETGKAITIRADVKNLTTAEQVYVATLWIDGTLESAQDIILAANEITTALFTVTRDTAGSYEARVDRLFGSFTVTAPAPPAPAPAPAKPTPAPTPAPTKPAPAPTPPVKPAPAPPSAPAPEAPLINWWLIGGIIAASIIVIAVVIWQIMVRRRD